MVATANGTYQYLLHKDGRLTWSAKIADPEHPDTPPPDARMFASLPSIAQLVEKPGIGIGIRTINGEVFELHDRYLAESEEVEAQLFRQLRRVPLPEPAQQLLIPTYFYVITTKGHVFTWGFTDRQEPQINALAAGVPQAVIGLSAGPSHECTLTVEGQAWCRGKNQRGQLGVGTSDDMVAAEFRQTQLPIVCALATGGDTNYALAPDGQVWWWGGDGSFRQPTPAPMPGLTGVVALAYPYALLDDQSLSTLSPAKGRQTIHFK